MKSKLRHPILRKVLLFAVLGLAGVLVGEVYQRLSRPTAEETLLALGASRTAMQTLTVNDVPVVAEVWMLPEFASTAPLRKSKGKTLALGNMVFVFNVDDIAPLRGRGVYPSDLPPLKITCEYVADTGRIRLVNGSYFGSVQQAEADFDAAARSAGWTMKAPGAWVKEGKLLFFKASETAHGTSVAISVQKEV